MTRPFTGRHMLAMMIGFFGIVIGVNVAMATLAEETFGGTVVDNSYVASQRFNTWLAAARAQERLGWHTALGLDRQRHVMVSARDIAGPLEDAEVQAIARHPLGAIPDVALAFRSTGGGRYVARASLPPGRWIVRLEIRRGRDAKRLVESLS